MTHEPLLKSRELSTMNLIQHENASSKCPVSSYGSFFWVICGNKIISANRSAEERWLIGDDSREMTVVHVFRDSDQCWRLRAIFYWNWIESILCNSRLFFAQSIYICSENNLILEYTQMNSNIIKNNNVLQTVTDILSND